MEYHAHIYWRSSDQKQVAIDMRKQLAELGCLVGSVHDEPIGPHPLPMFQAIYTTDNQNSVEQLIENNRQDLSVLLHESINDDVRDHTEGARWLGEQLDLDLVWLDRYVRGLV